jgi:hypothetical protein
MSRLMTKALIFLVLFSVPGVFVQAQGTTTTYIVTGSQPINARVCPLLTCAVARTFEPGAELNVVDVVQGDAVAYNDQWLQVDSDGTTLYVHSSLAELLPEEEASSPPETGRPSVDTSDWITHDVQGFTLDTPPSWIDASDLLSDEDLLTQLATAFGADPESYVQSVQDVLAGVDMYLLDMTTATSFFIWHEDMSGVPMTASLLNIVLTYQFEQGGAEIVSNEEIELPAGNAVRINMLMDTQVGQLTMKMNFLVFGLVTDKQVYYLGFTIPVSEFDEEYEAVLDRIVTSFRVEPES